MPDVFQIDLGATDWVPESVQALQEELARAFEAELEPAELKFVGCDTSAESTQPLVDDTSVQGFCGLSEAGASDQDSVSSRASKVVTVEVPPRVLTELRQPRKVALLASGRQTSKFSGEVRGFGADVALKLFDCGHFHLRETIGGSGAGLRGSIFEGRWQKAGGGVRLDFLLRYPCQQVRRREASVTYEAVPREVREATLELLDQGDLKKERLEGTLPTSCNDEGTGVVALRRERALPERQAPARQYDGDSTDEEVKELLRPQVRRPNPRPPPRREEEDWELDEPTWPMYLGICLFIVIIIVFLWLWYEETYAPEIKQDFDEL